MSQTILKEKLALYLELINPKQTRVLRNDLRTLGYCHGLAVCHSTMLLIGKLDWWEAALIQIANWDGELASLSKKTKLPHADNPNETLGHIFERVLNYIAFNHARIDRSWKNIRINDSHQENFLLPKNKYYDVLCPDKKIRHTQDKKCAAGFFTPQQMNELLDEKIVPHSICLIHGTYHTISVGFQKPHWIIYDPNYPHNIQSYLPIHKKFTSKALLVEEIQRIQSQSVAIEYATLEGAKIRPSFPQWNKMIKKSSLTLLKEYGFHLIASKTPDRLAEIIHNALKFKKGPQVIANALVEIDQEEWSGLHKLIYFSPDNIPLICDAVSRYSEGVSCIMKALAIIEPEEGNSAWHEMLNYAADYLPKILDIAERVPEYADYLALALLTRCKSGESGWDLLRQKAPQHQNRVTKIVLNGVEAISSDILTALIKELKLSGLDKHSSSFFHAKKQKPDKLIQALSAELLERQQTERLALRQVLR